MEEKGKIIVFPQTDNAKTEKTKQKQSTEEVKQTQSAQENPKVDVFQAGKDVIHSAVIALLQGLRLGNPRRSLEQVAKMCSIATDELILAQESQNNYRYIGGEFIISYINEAAFKLNIALYFKDSNNEWIQVAAESQPRKLQYLTDESIVELRGAKTVRFEINPPQNVSM